MTKSRMLGVSGVVLPLSLVAMASAVAVNLAKIVLGTNKTLPIASYETALSWQSVTIFTIATAVHVAGHMWATQRKIRQDVQSQWNHVVVPLMGPIWSATVVVVTWGIFRLTGNTTWAVIAAWVCILNLFCLMPFSPFSGARILNAILHSAHSQKGKRALLLTSLTLLLSLGLAGLHLWAVFGLLGLAIGYGELHRLPRKREREASLRDNHAFATSKLRELQLQLGCADPMAQLERLRSGTESNETLVQAFNVAKEAQTRIENRRLEMELERIREKQHVRLETKAGSDSSFIRANSVTSYVVGIASDRLLSDRRTHAVEGTSSIVDELNDFRAIRNLVGLSGVNTEYRVYVVMLLLWEFLSAEISEMEENLVKQLSPRFTALSFASYVCLVLAYATILLSVSHLPGADAALDLLKS